VQTYLITFGIFALAFFVAWRLCRLATSALRMLADLFDHFHTRTLAEMAIATVITSARFGDFSGEWTDQKTMERITCRLNDILLHNGYDIHHWDPRALIYAALQTGDLAPKLKAAIDETNSRNSCPASTSQTAPILGRDSSSGAQ